MVQERFVAHKKRRAGASGAGTSRKAPSTAGTHTKTSIKPGAPAGGVASRAPNGPKLSSQGGRLQLLSTNPDVSLWKGMCRTALLEESLENIGTLIEASQPTNSAARGSPFPLSSLTDDRITVAIQALSDAIMLLQSVVFSSFGCETEGTWHSKSVGERKALYQQWEAVYKLVELSEAAIPMKFSVLPPWADVSSAFTDCPSSLLPMASPHELHRRLGCLRRLKNLRECHRNIMPMLRRVRSRNEVVKLLFGSAGAGTVLIEPMPEVSSLHQREQEVMKDFLEQINSSRPSVDSWDFSFAPSLRVATGAYIIHKRDRADALTHLLHIAEFFGLPPFLRSIRITDGRGRPFATLPPRRMDDAQPTSAPLPSLYFSPYDLNPRFYDTSTYGHEQVVQDELIDLARRHCGCGILVGEADQVISLLAASAAAKQQLKVEDKLCHKVEEGADTANAREAPAHSERCEDPLLAFARATVRSQQGVTGSSQRSVTFAHWLCDNRWSITMSYYAIVLTVVLSGGCGMDENEASMEYPSDTTFYHVSAVCELTHPQPKASC